MDIFNKFSFENETITEGLTQELSVFYVLECFKKSTNRVLYFS